jgi:hypothetical protein
MVIDAIYKVSSGPDYAVLHGEEVYYLGHYSHMHPLYRELRFNSFILCSHFRELVQYIPIS